MVFENQINLINYICNYLIRNYVITLCYIYLWIFLGFLRPNLEFDSLYLPESTRYKSIALITIGVLIYQILRSLLKIVMAGVLLLIFRLIDSQKQKTAKEILFINLGWFSALALLMPLIGVVLFLILEKLGIWSLSFPPLFLLLCGYITAATEKTNIN